MANLQRDKKGRFVKRHSFGERFKKGHIPWCTGKKMSESHRKKLSESHKGQIPWCKGKKLSEAHKKTLSESHKGIFPSKETRKKLSIALKGHTVSKDTRKKISKIHKGKKISEEQKRKSVATRMKNGSYIAWNKGLKGCIHSGSFKKGHKHPEEVLKKISQKVKKAAKEGRIPQLFKSGKKNIAKKHNIKKKMSLASKKRFKNHPVSEETKKKLSKASKGRKHSKEAREKISKSKMGEKNPAWNGGSSFEPYGKEWSKELRLQTKQRDKFTCQECFITEEQSKSKLDVHHIDFDKQNNDPNNLICLCKSCHAQTKFDRDNWIEYFQNKIKGGRK